MSNLNQRQNRRRSGSALVMTLLLISVISSVSFAVTALAISEFRKASNLQDSIAAYYAAESGIEHGLLQNRIWRDAEISDEVYRYIRADARTTIPSELAPTKDTEAGSPAYYGLDSATTGYVPLGANRGNTWYGLKMYYRGPSLGKVDKDGNPTIDPATSPKIYRDSALEVNVAGAGELRIKWQPDPATKQNPPAPIQIGWLYFVEVILSADKNDMNIYCKQDKISRFFPVTSQGDPAPDISISFEGCNYRTVRLKPWNMSYMQFGLTLKSATGPGNVNFDNNLTIISSEGVSGRSKRALNIALPRSTKTILESEDFLFLSADSNLDL